MHQRPLLQSTRDFLEPEDDKIRGVKLHERYSSLLIVLGVAFLVGAIISYRIGGYRHMLVFGVVLGISGVLSEAFLKRIYGFSDRDAVRYYAMQFYDTPKEELLQELHKWNSNPFTISTEYHYPNLGHLVERAQQKENEVEFVRSRLPDTLRLIERQQNDNYQSLVSLDTDDFPRSYKTLIQEANYCFKSGAYISSAILVRKLVEVAIEEILTAKGLYVKLDGETLGDQINLFTGEVIEQQYGEEIAEQINDTLHQIRVIGNKSAHGASDPSSTEIETTIKNAHNALTILLQARSEIKTS